MVKIRDINNAYQVTVLQAPLELPVVLDPVQTEVIRGPAGIHMTSLTINEDFTITATFSDNSTKVVGSLDSAVKKYVEAIGDGSSSSITVTHSLGSSNVAISVRKNIDPYNLVYPEILIMDLNNIRINFQELPATNEYVVTVIG